MIFFIPLFKGIALIALLISALTTHAAEPVQALEPILDRVRDFLLSHHTNQTEAPEVQIGPLDQRLRLPLCGGELEVFLPRAARPLGNTSVGVRCPGPQPWTIYLSATVRVFGHVQVANRFLPRGTILAATDLRTERRDLTSLPGGYVMASVPVIGKRMQRSLPGGSVIPPRALATAPIIKRGERIMILARQGTIEATSSGIALNDAALGDRLQVRNESSQRLIEGTVIAAHQIEVEL